MAKPEPFREARVPPEFAPDQPHLVGVSGGRDSLALLHWLHGQGFRRLTVCHLDHGLRAESAEEAVFTRQFAETLGLSCRTAIVETAECARRQKISIETAARELRYDFFARVSTEQNCPRLLLGHHADDQVETFLLQILRGAGLSGLGGMAPLATRTVAGCALLIARPLLGVWRKDVDAYIADCGLTFREDPSNADLQHTRNRIRHLALPALETAFGRDPRPALWRAAEVLRAEAELAEAAPETQSIGAELDARWLRALPLAVQRRVIHGWLRQGGIADAGFEAVEAARGLLTSRGAKANLPGNRCARRRAQRLFLDAQAPPPRPRSTPSEQPGKIMP